MLTARDSVIDRVNGLDSGADDYIGKPFAIEEVLARMRTIKRRLGAEALQALDLMLDRDSRQVSRGSRPIDLSAREFDLLRCLLENKNRVLSRDFLLSEVWGFHYAGETNVLDVYIRYVRSKVDDGFDAKLIQTVRGAGYVIRDN